jgi:hypothetical protein
MENDPAERNNLFYENQHREVKVELEKKLKAYFAHYADPKYDRWKGGATKGTEILREN